MPRTDPLRTLALLLIALLLGGCATTGAMRQDPLKNTKKLAAEGHVSLYQNGAFRVPNTHISLIPPGPSALEFAEELAGLRARESFALAIRNAADSVYIVTEGTKVTYRAAKKMSRATNAGADAIRKLTSENGTLLVSRSSALGKHIIGKSWEISKETLAESEKAGATVAHGSAILGNQVSEGGTGQGIGLAKGSVHAAKEIVQKSSAAGSAVSEGGTAQGTGMAKGSVHAAEEISAQSRTRSKAALIHGGRSFVQGYAAVPAEMKRHAGEMGDSLQNGKFKEILAAENQRRHALSQKTVDLMSETINNYGADVSHSFRQAGKELGSYQTTGVSFAVIKSLRWVLQGILWDATIEPLGKMTAGAVGYLGVNFLAFPSLVVVREGAATTEVAVQVAWDTTKMGYDLVAPTGIAALAGVYSLVDFTGSHALAGATAVGGTVAGYGTAGVSTIAGTAIKAGGYAAAGVTAAAGNVAGYGEAGASKVAGVVIKGAGYAAGKGVQYIGVPLASAGIAVGGGTIGTVAAGAGMTAGGAVYVAGEAGAGTAQVFGNVIAGATLAGGTAASAAGGAAYGVYELSKAVVVPSGYELGSGIVLSYGTLSQIGAQAILGVSDCAYMVLSLEGPRWVLYAVKGDLGKGDNLPAGTVVDLKAMQKAGEKIYYLPVSNTEMKAVVQSTYDTLPEMKEGKRKATAHNTADPDRQ